MKRFVSDGILGQGALQQVLPATVDLYRRTLANWCGDVLAAPGTPRWQPAEPAGDYADRDWSRLYTGSILDD